MGAPVGSGVRLGSKAPVVFAILAVGGFAIACGAGGAGDESPATPETTAATAAPAATALYYHAVDRLVAGDAPAAWHALQALSGGDQLAKGTIAPILALVDAGRIHTAWHELVGVLAGPVEPDLTPEMLLVTLAAAALGRSDRAGAVHLLEDATRVAEAATAAALRQVLAALRADDSEQGLVLLRGVASELAAESHARVTCRALPSEDFERFTGVVAIRLLLDEEWRAHLGVQADAAAQDLVRRANAAFGGTPIRLEIASIGSWETPPDRTLRSLLLEVGTWAPPVPVNGIVVGLTAQPFASRGDGMHSGAAHAVIVRHDHDAHAEEALVLIHELGHHLGLSHWWGTYMQAIGFPATPRWTSCQRTALAGLLSDPPQSQTRLGVRAQVQSA